MKWRIATIVLAILLVLGGTFSIIIIVDLEAESDYWHLQYESLLDRRFNEAKLEIEQFFITYTGDSYYPARPWNAQESSTVTIEELVNMLHTIAQYYHYSDWQSFCEYNGITPAQAAAFIEWLAEIDYDDVRIVYQPEQAEFTAWVYFPRTKEGETLDNLTLDGGALLESTKLFVGAPSLETIEFASIYTACYALGTNKFCWWQTSTGVVSALSEFMFEFS